MKITATAQLDEGAEREDYIFTRSHTDRRGRTTMRSFPRTLCHRDTGPLVTLGFSTTF